MTLSITYGMYLIFGKYNQIRLLEDEFITMKFISFLLIVIAMHVVDILDLKEHLGKF
jgi:hypothetical protein